MNILQKLFLTAVTLTVGGLSALAGPVEEQHENLVNDHKIIFYGKGEIRRRILSVTLSRISTMTSFAVSRTRRLLTFSS